MSDREGGTSRRELLQRAGMGAAALAVPGVAGGLRRIAAGRSRSIPTPTSGSGTPARTLNFISENTAPTSAIAANLAPFKELTGIDIKISQLELTALVQKVALDLASGQGSYQIIYADPYQVLAPYHGALADLNELNARPGRPEGPGPGRLHPDPARRGREVRRQGALYALPYDAPTMIWMYRKDVFDANTATGCSRTSASTRCPTTTRPGSSTTRREVVSRTSRRRDPVRLRPSGQAARLADERLLQRAVGLRRRLLRRRRQRSGASAP